jgi:hypothetical protein
MIAAIIGWAVGADDNVCSGLKTIVMEEIRRLMPVYENAFPLEAAGKLAEALQDDLQKLLSQDPSQYPFFTGVRVVNLLVKKGKREAAVSIDAKLSREGKQTTWLKTLTIAGKLHFKDARRVLILSTNKDALYRLHLSRQVLLSKKSFMFTGCSVETIPGKQLEALLQEADAVIVLLPEHGDGNIEDIETDVSAILDQGTPLLAVNIYGAASWTDERIQQTIAWNLTDITAFIDGLN